MKTPDGIPKKPSAYTTDKLTTSNYINPMSYLKFDKNLMINLEQSLRKEMLRTNRAGAYHCSTVVGCNTRKQHGLLVIPMPGREEYSPPRAVVIARRDRDTARSAVQPWSAPLSRRCLQSQRAQVYPRI